MVKMQINGRRKNNGTYDEGLKIDCMAWVLGGERKGSGGEISGKGYGYGRPSPVLCAQETGHLQRRWARSHGHQEGGSPPGAHVRKSTRLVNAFGWCQRRAHTKGGGKKAHRSRK